MNHIKKYKLFLEAKVRWFKDGKLGDPVDPGFEVPEYDDFITDDVFRNFLIDHGAYELFIEYCRDFVKMNFDNIMEESEGRIIDIALSWYNTPPPKSGKSWSELNDIWSQMMSNKRKMNEAKVRWFKDGKFSEPVDPGFEVPEYDDFITDNEFRNFLIKYGAYDAFIKYCNTIVRNNFSKYFSDGQIIDHALSWDSTPKPKSGNSWSKLNSMWYENYRKR